jgi:Lon protease (S16) C-terminal proteolytic domain
MTEATTRREQRLEEARVLVELDELTQAEAEVAAILEESADDLEALRLYAKIKHMRGQLSLALACYAQLQARGVVPGESSRMHLESMLRMAQDPERGAGEFLAVGQRLVQKPTAYLALEEAFQLYVARRPHEARSVCRRAAARYREREAEVYKLSVLAEAWISELSGDLEAACSALEHLGRERGFEADLDRVMALVGLYELVGTRDKLEAAVNICRFLERNFGPRFVAGRLALLQRRLGREAEAVRSEAQHLTAYRRWMHRPTFAEVVRVAARRLLPLERLRALTFPEHELPKDISPDERAIAQTLVGDPAQAGRILAIAGESLALKCRANLAALMESDGEQAVILAVRALRADPSDPDLAGWLLDTQARAPREEIAEVFREGPVGSRVLAELEVAAKTAPADARIWRRLAIFFALQPGGYQQQGQFDERAAALELAAQDRARASGKVLAAAIYRFFGRPSGLIHEVWATRERPAAGQAGGMLRRDDILGAVTDELRDSVRNVFLAVREYARAKFPHRTRDILDYNYCYKVTKEDEPSSGVSAGIPTALAFLSLFLQQPIATDRVSTGTLVADAHDVLTVGPVGDIEHKVEAAYHRNLSMIIVPRGNRPELEQSALVPRAVTHEIARYVADFDEAVRLAFGEPVFS